MGNCMTQEEYFAIFDRVVGTVKTMLAGIGILAVLIFIGYWVNK